MDYFSWFEQIDDNDTDIISLEVNVYNARISIDSLKKSQENSNIISIQKINSEDNSKQSVSHKSSPQNPNMRKEIKIKSSNELSFNTNHESKTSKIVQHFAGKGNSLNIAHLKTREEERQELPENLQ